jgi:protocatechuate 3,4-dioxygenase beta subunit
VNAMENERITRRNTLLRLGGLVAAAVGAGAWEREAHGAGPAGVASGELSCVLAPEQTEGPYYIAGEAIRRNITEGHPGTPLTLKLKVVNASTCKPIKNATVEIWHCDAAGDYSGFGNGASSRTFLRGGQKTNAQGIATFLTIYPGWYQGRTVHIHIKVHVGGNVVHTGQLYFSDTVTDAVYAASPYSSRPNRTTRNAADSIYRNGGSKSQLKLTKSGSAYLGAITMGVTRS